MSNKKMSMREKIYNTINLTAHPTRINEKYNFFMIIVIFISLIPLLFKPNSSYGKIMIFIEYATAAIFVVDYALHLFTADYELGRGKWSFLIYPFTPWALLNLITVIAALRLFPPYLLLFKLLNIFRMLRMFRIIRYSSEFQMIGNIIKKNKKGLIYLFSVSFFYLVVVAILMFNAEPELFPNFLEAFYWSAMSLTVMNPMSIDPVTTLGKVINVISAFWGIAIVAMPSGLLTAAFMEELEENKKRKDSEDD